MSRWLVLDLDGTLVDSVPDLAAALNRCLENKKLAPLTHDVIRTMVGDGTTALVERGFRARGAIAESTDLVGFLTDYKINAAVHTRPYPGVKKTLQKLKEQDWTMLVCTNKPVGIAKSLLSDLGLYGFFALVSGGDSCPFRKPDSRHLNWTLEEIGGKAERAIMVGDHQHDIHAARGAGLKSIWAAWGYSKNIQDADFVAKSFSDLPLILDAIGMDKISNKPFSTCNTKMDKGSQNA